MTRLHRIFLLLLVASHGFQDAQSFTIPRGSSHHNPPTISVGGGWSRGRISVVVVGTTTTSLFGQLRSTLVQVRDSLLSRDRTETELKDGIAFFYDRSSKLWEDVWGEHMHHGYYVPENRTDHVQAQIDLIDEVLKWAGVPEENGDDTPKRVVDVGCGIGGSSRHIVKKYGEKCTAQGITLSPYQANRGNELAKEQGLADRASFQVCYFKLLQHSYYYLGFTSHLISSHLISHHTCISMIHNDDTGGRCNEHAL